MWKRLHIRRECNGRNFTCNKGWHWLWHKFTIEEKFPCTDHCTHEIWKCSCGKKWEVDRIWVEGTVYITAREIT